MPNAITQYLLFKWSFGSNNISCQEGEKYSIYKEVDIIEGSAKTVPLVS